MSVNNQMYKLFNDLKQGYAENNPDIIEQCTRCWMQLATDNPFMYDTPEYEEFFQMKKCYTIWSKGYVDQKINRRRMIQHAKKLMELNPKQPYIYDKKAEEEEKKKQQQERIQESIKKSENEDVLYVMKLINDAYLKRDEVSFEQFTLHLMDIVESNPYSVGSDEYEQFSIMMNSYSKVPINKHRLFDACTKLCEIINNTEIYPEKIKKIINEKPKTVLGIVPEEKEEKRSRFSFLHLRKKEGE